MAQLITEWSTPDPQLADMLRGISAMPEYSVERMAAEAALHTFQAQWLHKRIGAYEVHDAQSARARKAGQARRRPTADP